MKDGLATVDFDEDDQEDDTFGFGVPNAESFEAIHEGDAFLASGKEGCFTSGADLIAAVIV